MVDSALPLFSGERTVQGASARALAKASREAATRGIREARQVLRDGATAEQLAQMDIPREVNTGNRIFDGAVNMVFRSMSASDRVFKVFAFERSLQEQMKLAKADAPTEAMRIRAVEDADFATFNNDNMAATAWSGAKATLRTKGGAAGRVGGELVDPLALLVGEVRDAAAGGDAQQSAVIAARDEVVTARIGDQRQHRTLVGGDSDGRRRVLEAGGKQAYRTVAQGKCHRLAVAAEGAEIGRAHV